MKAFFQIIMFLGWMATLIWAGLELEKIHFFQSLYTMLG
jgi:hypothetical protein